MTRLATASIRQDSHTTADSSRPSRAADAWAMACGRPPQASALASAAGAGCSGCAPPPAHPRPFAARLKHSPAAPYQRLLADPRTSDEVRSRVSALLAILDPVRLLSEIRLAQRQLVEIADRPVTGEESAPSAPTLVQFLLGLRTLWKARCAVSLR